MPNRKWKYVEPGDDGVAVEVVVSEDEIKRLYYPWWTKKMRKVGKEDQINLENCIEDWTVVHWAMEIKEEPNEP